MAIDAFKNRYRTNAKPISDRTFYLVMSATLLFGFAVNAIEVAFMTELIAAWDPLIFFIVYTVLLIAGVLINVISRNPVVSFIGYCMVVLPIGALLAITVPAYAPTTVLSAFLATAFLSAAMALIAFVRPQIFYSVWKILSVCLFVSLLWSLIAMFTPLRSALVWLDWLVVLLFCCYIGFDVSFARNRPKTLDNAVDSACGLYLDVINIFIRLLAIFSRNRK